MEGIVVGIAELSRPVIALLVKGVFQGVVLLLSAPRVLAGSLFRKPNKELGKQDALRVSRLHESNGHQEREWHKCPECVEFIGLVKSARAIADSVSSEATDAEMSRFHKQSSHREPS